MLRGIIRGLQTLSGNCSKQTPALHNVVDVRIVDFVLWTGSEEVVADVSNNHGLAPALGSCLM